MQETVSKTFETESDLLSVFTGSQRLDDAFEGLGEGRFRYEDLYLKLYVEPYFMVQLKKTLGFRFCSQAVIGRREGGMLTETQERTWLASCREAPNSGSSSPGRGRAGN